MSHLKLKKKPQIADHQKPMFILISENEVQGSYEQKYVPYYRNESNVKQELQIKKQRASSQKDLKKYAPVPLKKFIPNIDPPQNNKVQLLNQHKSMRRFKF